jgi:baculoviral IAP repeat-containing protein 6
MDEQLNKKYTKALKKDKLKYDLFKPLVKINGELSSVYCDKTKFFMTPQIAEKMGHELVLLDSIEFSCDSAVFVCQHSDNSCLFSVLIFGRPDSPYDSAGFIFHICLSDEYPNKPPHICLTSSLERINPNIYKDGKVLLSMLNTWQAKYDCEKWNPKESSVYQIIMALQFMILNNEPYYNEPGREWQASNKYYQKDADKYHEEIREVSVVYGMINLLKKQPEEFKTIIRDHFKIKKDYINNLLTLWDLEKYKDEINSLIDGYDTIEPEKQNLSEIEKKPVPTTAYTVNNHNPNHNPNHNNNNYNGTSRYSETYWEGESYNDYNHNYHNDDNYKNRQLVPYYNGNDDDNHYNHCPPLRLEKPKKYPAEPYKPPIPSKLPSTPIPKRKFRDQDDNFSYNTRTGFSITNRAKNEVINALTNAQDNALNSDTFIPTRNREKQNIALINALDNSGYKTDDEYEDIELDDVTIPNTVEHKQQLANKFLSNSRMHYAPSDNAEQGSPNFFEDNGDEDYMIGCDGQNSRYYDNNATSNEYEYGSDNKEDCKDTPYYDFYT